MDKNFHKKDQKVQIKCGRRPPHPLVGSKAELTSDQQIGGWYYCVRQEIDRFLSKDSLKLTEGYYSTFSFFINNDDTLSDLKILSSSGPAESDKALIAAIQESFPLKTNFDLTVNEIVRNKKFMLDFSNRRFPCCQFKIIE